MADIYQEIRYDYVWGPAVESRRPYSEEDGILAAVSIDGWKTARDDEQGEVIANVILTLHGDVVVDFHNNGARMNESVLSAIQAAREKLRCIWQDEKKQRCRPPQHAETKATYRKMLYVPSSVLQTIKGYLQAQSEGEYQGEDSTIIYTVKFPDGKEMDIKCCGCQEAPSWTEAVLFDQTGCQIAYTEASDEFECSWELEDNGTHYHVDIKGRPDDPQKRLCGCGT